MSTTTERATRWTLAHKRRVKIETELLIKSADGHTVAGVVMGNGHGERNGLMLAAAPELAEAARRLLRGAAIAASTGDEDSRYIEIHIDDLERLEAALRKAGLE